MCPFVVEKYGVPYVHRVGMANIYTEGHKKIQKAERENRRVYTSYT